MNFSKCEPQARNPPADYEAADRTYVVSSQRRVLKLNEAPQTAPTPAPPPRPRDTPGTSAEPDYPPG